MQDWEKLQSFMLSKMFITEFNSMLISKQLREYTVVRSYLATQRQSVLNSYRQPVTHQHTTVEKMRNIKEEYDAVSYEKTLASTRAEEEKQYAWWMWPLFLCGFLLWFLP
eukprot:UN32595